VTLLYLVRHGETDWNRARRIQGSTDIPLNELGRSQAVDAGELLARRPFDLVAASPLSRALETGGIIAARLGLPEPVVIPALVERNYGVAEGLTGAEIETRFPAGAEVPGRESVEVLVDRVVDGLIEVARLAPGGSAVVATHGAVIRAVVTTIAPDLDLDQHRGVFIRNGSIHTLRIDDDGLTLVHFDDPIEAVSDAPGRFDFGYQNALEREGGGA